MISLFSKEVIAGWLARLIVILLSFVNTKLIIECIGTDGFAGYSILASLTGWLSICNLGIPTTIQNQIAKLKGTGLDYTNVRNASYGTFICVTLLTFPIATITSVFSSNYLLINYSLISPTAVLIIIFGIFLAAQSQIFTQILHAENKSIWPNIYPALTSSLLSLILSIFVIYNIKDYTLFACALTFCTLAPIAHALKKLKFFDSIKFEKEFILNQIKSSKDIIKFSILSTITLSIDYIIMSRILSPGEISTYNLTSRLFGLALILQSVLLASNWSHLSILLYAKKFDEAKALLNKLLLQGLAIGVIMGVINLTFSDKIISIWSSGKLEKPDFLLCLAWFFYILIRIYTDTYAMALLCFNKTNIINEYIPRQALISAISQLILGHIFGPTGIIIGIILSFIFTATWILPISFKKITRNTYEKN